MTRSKTLSGFEHKLAYPSRTKLRCSPGTNRAEPSATAYAPARAARPPGRDLENFHAATRISAVMLSAAPHA